MTLSNESLRYIGRNPNNPRSTTTQNSTTLVSPIAIVTANTASVALAASINPPSVTVDTTTTTTTTQSQVGLQFGSSISTQTVSIGESVVDTSVINTIRSKEIVFSSYHLKPLTRLYAFFDNVNVDKFIFTSTRIVLNKTVHTNRTKEFSATGKTVKVLFAKGSTIFIKEVFTNPSLTTNSHLVVGNTFTWDSITYTIVDLSQSTSLTTDKDGYVAGTFIIPNTAELSFKTGTRSFLICDSSNNNAAEISTAAEFAYYASGISQTKQSTTLATRINQVTVDPILKSKYTEESPVTVTTPGSSPEPPVVVIDDSAPIITSFSPTRGKTDVNVNTNIVITFNETIVAGSGAITLMKPNGTVIPSTHSINGSILTIDPTSSLSNNTLYKVVLDNGCVKDSSNNLFAGSSDYSFTTVSLPVVDPVPSYNISPNKSWMYEGESVTFTVTVTNDTTTTFYWKFINAITNVSTNLSGSVNLVNGQGTFTLTYPTQGLYVIDLSKTAGGTVIKRSSTVTIKSSVDVSTPTYTITPSTTEVVEGATITFNVVTQNVGTATLYYNLSGTGITTADFDGGLTGTVSIVNNIGSFTKTVAINAD